MKNNNEPTMYKISVAFESWTKDALEAGESYERGVVIENETVDTGELKRIAIKYDIDEASSSIPAQGVWFKSTYEDQDTDYFNHGINKYYSLHIINVNEDSPTPEDIQRVANLIGIKFDQAIELEDDYGDDLCP